MNRIRLDFEDEDIKSALADCVAGEPKTITVTLTPDDVGDGFIEGTLDGLKYKKPKKKVEYEDDDEDDEMPPAVKRVKIKATPEDEEM